MSRRIIIHAGFHKTGTTTLQETLALNAGFLLPHVELYLQHGALISSLSRAVLDFSGNRGKKTRDEVRTQAEVFFSLIDQDDPRPVLVSSESLSGHFPGASGVSKYAPAPLAIETIRDAWATVSGTTDGFETYYSTRRNGWLASCHWQRLKTNRSKIGLKEYCEKFAIAADHESIINDIRARIGAHAVHSMALEDMDHPLDPILEILNLSHLRNDMNIPTNANTSLGEDAREKLLALNRSNTWGKEFDRAKHAILHSLP
jgi:hypothetical protein